MGGETSMGGAVFAWAASTDVGAVRVLNEDAVLADAPVFVVADGMGGHDAGEVASAATVDGLRTLAGPVPVAIDAVAEQLHAINAELWTQGSGGASSMGTTGVGLVLVDNGGVPGWLVFNVGDSRAYCLADGSLVQISKDHSYVQELVDAGELEAEEARTHPHRNVVTRALGVDEVVRPDYWMRPVRPGERYLLCSDGLTGELGDDVIADVLDAGFPAGETVEGLVEMAVEAGGRDNVTALIVDVVSVPAWDEGTTETRPDGLRARDLAAGGPATGGPLTGDLAIDAVPGAGPRTTPRPPPPKPWVPSPEPGPAFGDVPAPAPPSTPAPASAPAAPAEPSPGGGGLIDGLPDGLGLLPPAVEPTAGPPPPPPPPPVAAPEEEPEAPSRWRKRRRGR